MTRRNSRGGPGGPANPGFVRRLARAARRVLGILLVLLAALYGLVCRIGLPRNFCDRIEARAREMGLDLRVNQIRPTWSGTVRLDGVRLAPAGSAAIDARMERAVIRFDLREALRGRAVPVEVSLAGGEIRVPLGEDADSDLPEIFRVSVHQARVRRSGSRVQVDLSGGLLDGLALRISGSPDLAGWPGAAPRQNLRQTIDPWIGRAVPVLRAVRQVSDHIVWGDRAGILLEWSGGPDVPAGGELNVRAEGRNSFFYGQALEEWSVHAPVREGRIEPLDAEFACAGDRMRLRGRVDTVGRILDLSAEGTWNSASLLRRVRSWIPDEAARPPDPVLRGSARIEIRTGEVAWTNAASSLAARIRIEDPAEFFGVPFSRLDLQVRRDGDRLLWNLAELELGWIAGSGRVTGDGSFCPATGELAGKASGTGDPAGVLAFMTPAEAHRFGNLRFLGEPPRLSAEFRCVFGAEPRVELTGRVDGRDFVYQGTSVDEAGFDLSVRDETVRFDRLVVRRPEGELTGSVALFLREGQVGFDVQSRLDPDAVARVIGPATHRFIQQFRFEGPASVAGGGKLNYRNPVSGDLRLEVEAQRAGMDWALADQIACTLALSGRRLEFTGIRGQAYGGSLSGDAVIDLPAAGEERSSYTLRGEISNAEVARILRDIRPDVTPNPELGRVTLRTDMQGRIGEGCGPTVRGTGSCEIRGSRLFSLPLLGGLSRIFSRIAPGFGYLSQSELTADCRIQDSRIHSRDLRLTGPLLSMRARGSLGFDLSLDYILEAQLLRRGPIAGTVRILTLPLTRLLEIELGGTVLEPRWRTRNFSTEEFPAPERKPAEPGSKD